MKTTHQYRPARRMPAVRLEQLRARNEARRQAREDARQQALTPTPEWEAAPRLTALPGGLYWSNQAPVPVVGALVTINRDGQPQQAKVTGYCHAAGFLGLVTETTPLPKTAPRRRQSSARNNCVFGSQLRVAA